MEKPNKALLQIPFLLGLLLTGANAALMYFGIPEQKEEIEYALTWHSYGALLPYSISMPIWYGMIISMVVGGIGFVFFQRWVQITLAVLIFVSIALIPFQGLYVSTAIHDFFYLTGNTLMVVPLILSFAQPWNILFKRKTEPDGSGQPI